MVDLLSHPETQRQWKRIGTSRRAGVCVPLFSVYSRKSAGIGELPDLKRVIDWVVQAGMSLVQLLPMNDVGDGFRPYDAQSSIALEPMYLALDQLAGIAKEMASEKIRTLKERFPTGRDRVDYGIKQAKLDCLWELYQGWSPDEKTLKKFDRFRAETGFWLDDYAVYKALKEKHAGQGWEEWPAHFRGRDSRAVDEFREACAARIEFFKWVQWQLFEQFSSVKRHAKRNNVLMIGDLPFLVSRDSADVWSHAAYFDLNYSSGAPPDAYFADGQRWGMPPYRWDRMAAKAYDLLLGRLHYAGHFYDLFRIDHAVGVFRIWTIPLSEPLENGGRNGVFRPENERHWEAHGRELLSVLAGHTGMLPCAEDLGTVPECSPRVLREFGIPGLDVQRWMKEEQADFMFQAPDRYRANSVSLLSTHDMMPFAGWWEYEAGTVDELLFRRQCGEAGILFEQVKDRLFDPGRSSHGRLRWRDEVATLQILAGILGRGEEAAGFLFSLYRESYGEKNKFWSYAGFTGAPEERFFPLLARRALERAAGAASIFNVQLITDWLALGDVLSAKDPAFFRINTPGVTSGANWSCVLPLSIEEIARLPLTGEIREINRRAGRV